MSPRNGGSGHEASKRGFFASRANLVLLVFLAVAGFYLVSEHWAHLLGAGPLLLLLGLCVGMHFFMHGSHGGHGTESADDGPPPHQGGESRHHRPEAPEQKDPR